MPPIQRHISVCIPTYKRPGMLGRCLDNLAHQQLGDLCLSIVVADNDSEQSAKELVLSWQQQTKIEVSYHLVPEKNISAARNAAVLNASGDWIAFIDDDEFPEPQWIMNLYGASVQYSADGVLGPVVPHFEGNPPHWLIKSGLCERRSFPTGTVLRDTKFMRTGNLLFRKGIVEGMSAPFDLRLGHSGGEDADFFDRMLRAGRRFVWCNEARVHEEVPKSRQSARYHVQRAIIRGVTTADQERFFGLGTLRSILAVIIYTASLPFLLATGKHAFMKYAIKDCDHLAKLLAHCGVRILRERTF